jgi:hypothetical protein
MGVAADAPNQAPYGLVSAGVDIVVGVGLSTAVMADFCVMFVPSVNAMTRSL